VNLQITSHGRWLDSDVRSVIDEQGRYSLWVDPTPLWIALLQHTEDTEFFIFWSLAR